MHSHLVAIEVGVERRTDERVKLDCRTLDQHRLERLDRQAVEGRCAVEKHQVVLDNLFEYVPYVSLDAFNVPLGALDVVGKALRHEATHNERLEQLQRHPLREAALVQL